MYLQQSEGFAAIVENTKEKRHLQVQMPFFFTTSYEGGDSE